MSDSEVEEPVEQHLGLLLDNHLVMLTSYEFSSSMIYSVN